MVNAALAFCAKMRFVAPQYNYLAYIARRAYWECKALQGSRVSLLQKAGVIAAVYRNICQAAGQIRRNAIAKEAPLIT